MLVIYNNMNVKDIIKKGNLRQIRKFIDDDKRLYALRSDRKVLKWLELKPLTKEQFLEAINERNNEKSIDTHS